MESYVIDWLFISNIVEQENEDVKKLFAEIPDEEKRQIQKLSFKLAEVGEEKSKLNT